MKMVLKVLSKKSPIEDTYQSKTRINFNKNLQLFNRNQCINNNTLKQGTLNLTNNSINTSLIIISNHNKFKSNRKSSIVRFLDKNINKKYNFDYKSLSCLWLRFLSLDLILVNDSQWILNTILMNIKIRKNAIRFTKIEVDRFWLVQTYHKVKTIKMTPIHFWTFNSNC